MDKVDTVVQPDLVVVCDPDKLIEKGIWGPPDWVVGSPFAQHGNEGQCGRIRISTRIAE